MQFCTNVNINYPEGCEGMIDSCGCYTKEQIDAIVATKLAIADVIDALDSTDATKPLSAAQGKALKTLINNLTTLLNSDNVNLDTLQEIVDFIELNRATLDTLSIGNIAGLQNALNAKADAGHNHDSVYAVIGHTHQLKTINMQDISGIGNISLVGTSELPAYSTSEVLTSERWTDGKPIYKKSIIVSTGAISIWNNNPIDFSSMDTLIDVRGHGVYFSSWGGYIIPDGSVDSNGGGVCGILASKTNFQCISYRNDFINTQFKFTIFYTKTMDTSSSPVALVGSSQNITTGVEYLVPKIIDGKQVYGKRINFGALPNNTIKDMAIPEYNPAYTYNIEYGESYTSDGTTRSSVMHSHTITTYINGENIECSTTNNYSAFTDTCIILHYTK